MIRVVNHRVTVRNYEPCNDDLRFRLRAAAGNRDEETEKKLPPAT
jgi:hypothetical protein